MLHGGARTIPPASAGANLAGAEEALAIAQAILSAGGTALDAVEAAVRSLEDNPVFNAGCGSVRNRDGDIELDAAIMDGTSLDVGAVAALRNVRNPISVARRLLSDRATFLVGDGARRFADEIGAEPALSSPAASSASCDTVGCIARDMGGHYASAVSTGGLEGARAGRVGDAPLPGCGYYADNEAGAVCFSGDGEHIMRMVLAARVITDLETGVSAQKAADLALSRLARVGGEAGVIVVDQQGEMGWAHNSDHFAIAMQSAAQPAYATLQRGGAPS
jgi:L-asparaginase / beta-aspartyl-peptidase